jgi:hypothetical protein
MEKNNEHSEEQLKVVRLVHDPKNGKRVDAETFFRALSEAQEGTIVMVEHQGTEPPARLACAVRFKPPKEGEEAA